MLAYARRDDSLALRDLVDSLDDIVRLNKRAVTIVVERVGLLKLRKLRAPGLELRRDSVATPVRYQRRQGL